MGYGTGIYGGVLDEDGAGWGRRRRRRKMKRGRKIMEKRM